MLQKLAINNYAIIDKLAIAPDGHFNVVTGETGAGKSIILGALSLILGERADTSVLINKEEKCVVEGHFEVSGNERFAAAMQEEDLDNEPVCIIRREIGIAGKSRAFVNDTPVTLAALNKLTGLLVDLHQQFGHLALQEDSFQFDIIDAVAQNSELRKNYATLYKSYKTKLAALESLKQQQQKQQQEADYKQFLLNELTEMQFKENEIEDAEQQLKQLAHAERILTVLHTSKGVLNEGEQPLTAEIKRISQQLQSIADVMPDSIAVQQRINAALIELKDITDELDTLAAKVNVDEQLMRQLQERIDAGNKLFKKHNLKTTAELIVLQQQLESELQESVDLNEKIISLEKEIGGIQVNVMKEAEKISQNRKKAAPTFEQKINELLALVDMPNAKVKITLEHTKESNLCGIDTIEFLLDANRSGQWQPIHKAASGGEMSRIMLCIKSLTAKAMALPTLIFDEVDTGISGEAAKQVGVLLRELAQYHQVICITHQPQVAAKGTTHLYVYKEEGDKGMIKTRLRTLNKEERVQAIARMIGGEPPTNTAIANAKELVGV
jgi:DNA repair protein RecN (Recombination protein N)